ncbi:MAG: hypothetical protein A2176_00900 [Spirochaetes bacterium RBG_13_51_14]|nr:MAG: hypothetical protein A2176_00900 [Spirochaetes bacterium RBG_13_51_14]
MDNNRLLIKNLDYQTTAEHIEHLFSPYGDINRIRVNRSRGTGLVEMTSAAEAKRVRDNLDGSVLWGRSLKIDSIDSPVRYRLMNILGRFF